MARKQKRSSSEKQSGTAKLRGAIDVLTTGFSCLVLLAMLMGLLVGRESMIREAGRLRSMPVRVQFDWPPLAVPPGGVLHRAIDGVPNTWLDVKSRRTLEQIVLSHVSEDPFDAASLQDAQRALMETGWFDGRCTLSREPSGVIRVTGAWREPVAAVRFGDRDYVVASRGERLPPQYQPDGSGLKVVIGPQMTPPKFGDIWIGGDVQAGLTLLDFLRTMPFSHQVAAVDVSEYNTRKRLLIVTDRGSTIVWGGEPGHFHAGQARDDSKRGRLLRLFQESGRIDNGQDVLNVSLSSGY
jgi:hypothetical protein